MIRTVAMLAGLVLLASASLSSTSAAGPAVSVQGERLVDAVGQPLFVLGANYEGPVDRAWQMWDEGKFDPVLIAQDFDRARWANLSVLRVFVQRSLAEDIRDGRWGKLDQVLDLADQRGLKLILTFADYGEPSVANLAAIDRAVAERYRGRSTIFAYDLKNEPRFWDLATSIYPPGVRNRLQDPELVAALGETIARSDIGEYRSSGRGNQIPSRMNDDEAWVYANVLAAYLRFLAEAEGWAREPQATVVHYLLSSDSAGWDILKQAMNDTLAAWMQPRLDALRAADPGRPITIGHVDPIIASLPVNAWLDYRTLHRYPGASSAGVRAAARLFDVVGSAVPGKPMMLGEFGFANHNLDEDRSAALEVEMIRAIREAGGAGALKWMLNDFPSGFNPRENTFGMFRGDGSPKPVVGAFQGLGTLCPLGEAARERGARPADYPLADGHFFTQTNGHPLGADLCGYSITNADGIPFWDAFRQLGGVPALGYPVGRRFILDGFVVQPMQKAILQWRPAEQEVWLVNTLDWLHQAGKDEWLYAFRQVPAPFDTQAEAGQSWEQVLERRIALLNDNTPIRDRLLDDPDWIDRFGLPTATADYPEVFVVRTQRGVLQQWKTDQPWARAGEITVANAGDLAKEAGLLPPHALLLESPPP